MKAAHTNLAELLRHLGELTGSPGHLAEVLDLADLSFRTGIPAHTLVELLAGGPAPAMSVGERIQQKFHRIRKTRRRADGWRYSLSELAKIAGTSRHELSWWSKDSMPSAHHTGRMSNYFGVPTDCFTATEPESLCAVLASTLQELENKSLSRSRLRCGRHASPDRLQGLAEWAEVVTRKHKSSADTGTV